MRKKENIKMENFLKIEGYELLSQKVYRVLKTEIVKGNLKPGTKLLEDKIANQMGVSRTPVREALRELAVEGFVEMTPNQGMAVTTVSLEDLKEVLQIRGVLEGLATYLAAKMITREDIIKLERIINKMNICIVKDDTLAFSDLNADFHDLILKICGNKRLIRICSNLSDRAHRFRIRSLSIPGRLKYALKEHQEILEALKKKDSEQADKLSRKHINNVLKNILAHDSKK